LVVVRDRISAQEADTMRGRIMRSLPDVADVVIIQAESVGVFRPEDEAPPATAPATHERPEATPEPAGTLEDGYAWQDRTTDRIRGLAGGAGARDE
jgi:hypothetical protein